MKICQEDLLANIFKFVQSIFDIYCKDMADFRMLQDRLESPTLRSLQKIQLWGQIIMQIQKSWRCNSKFL